jgi:hypothetical protein
VVRSPSTRSGVNTPATSGDGSHSHGYHLRTTLAVEDTMLGVPAILAAIDTAHRDLERDATTESVIVALSLAIRVYNWYYEADRWRWALFGGAVGDATDCLEDVMSVVVYDAAVDDNAVTPLFEDFSPPSAAMVAESNVLRGGVVTLVSAVADRLATWTAADLGHQIRSDGVLVHPAHAAMHLRRAADELRRPVESSTGIAAKS